MQKLVSRDLAMNIFHKGNWGSFRHTPLHTGELLVGKADGDCNWVLKGGNLGRPSL